MLKTNTPIRCEYGGVFICASGAADIIIDTNQYHIEKNSLAICFPYSIVQLLEASEDFDGVMIGATAEFFATLDIRDKSTFYVDIRNNPCILLTTNEASRLSTLCDNIIQLRDDQTHPFRSEINTLRAKIMAYEVAAIYSTRSPIKRTNMNRGQEVFRRFIFAALDNVFTQRTLKYYADKLNLTPRHLSTVVKEVSGRTAGEHIANFTIMYMKQALTSTEDSIAEISYEFNFPNPSFFTQYFKKHTGLTPKEYREVRSRGTGKVQTVI